VSVGAHNLMRRLPRSDEQRIEYLQCLVCSLVISISQAFAKSNLPYIINRNLLSDSVRHALKARFSYKQVSTTKSQKLLEF
jgi:hypothetical protein